MPIIKDSINSLKFLEVECEESIYMNIDNKLLQLGSYLEQFKKMLQIDYDDVDFEYYDSERLAKFNNLYTSHRDTKYLIPDGTIIVDPKDYEEAKHKVKTIIEKEEQAELFIMSFVVMSCSVFEKSIEKICYKIKSENKLALSRKDLKNMNGKKYGLVSSFKKYLHIYGRINSIDKKLWSVLYDIQKIRNFIVHSNLDKIFDDKAKDITLCQRYLPCHGIHQQPEIVYLSWKICEFSLKIFRCFFKQLHYYHFSILNRDPNFDRYDYDIFNYIKSSNLPD
jgi:hypothetical protein